jgi:TolA-binding protein
MKTPADGWDREEQEALRDLEPPLDAVRDRYRADPPIELLRAARAGVLPEALQNDVSRHLAGSAWSRALVDGALAEDAVLDRKEEARLLSRIQKVAREVPRRQSVWRWLSQPAFGAAAAGIIVIAGLFAWQSRARRTEEGGPPQPVVADAAPSRAPAFHLPLEAPVVRLSVAVLTWRGAGRQNQLLTDLKPGLDAFRSGDYAAANEELSTIAAAFPDSFDVRYYQGVSRLFLNDIAGAIESLTAAERTADSSFAADLAWYLAVASERAGKIEDARRQLTPVCNAGAARAADACAALRELK